MRHLIAAMFLSAAALPAAALTPEDFARGVAVHPGQGALQRLSVPAEVYRWTTAADLADVRLFNAEGELVPYVVRRPADTPGFTPWQGLPVFHLPAAGQTGNGTAVNIQLGDDGTVVAVQGGGSASPGRSAWLLDASALEQPMTELAVEWPEQRGDFIAEVRLEGSDDLNQWQTLIPAATLASLRTDGEQVRADRLELPRPSRHRYLKLVQQSGAEPLAPAAVQARSSQPGEPERQWLELGATSAGDDGYLYQTGGHFPVDRAAVALAQPTYLTEATLWSRAHADTAWVDHGRHRFYRVAITSAADAPVTSSDPLRLGGTTHPHWRVTGLSSAAADPLLRLGWVPHELVFLSQGSDPLLLAYGAAGVEPGNWPLRALTEAAEAPERLSALPAARTGEFRELGGPGRLEALSAVDWKTVTLWVVLVAGVVLVGVLAYRVVR